MVYIKRMKRTILLIVFIISQLIIVCGYIHLESQRINLQYVHQKHIKLLAELAHTKKNLQQKLLTYTNLDYIDQYAREQLNLKPISLEQIKHIA